MNSSRNINASLFVTVISACLGLLIVGVPVQAQSPSASKGAGCSDRTSPEVEALLNEHAFIHPIAKFISNVGIVISLKQYDLAKHDSEEFEVRIGNDGDFEILSFADNKWLNIAAETSAKRIKLDFDIIPTKFYLNDNKWKQVADNLTYISFLFEDSSLVVTSKLEQPSIAHAQKLAATYNSYFSLGACRERGEADEVLYQNTKALADNNQVLIVTHLPRAALSELLARKPEAN